MVCALLALCQVQNNVDWVDTLRHALDKAAKQEQLVLVDCSPAGSELADRVRTAILGDGASTKAMQGFVCFRADPDRDRALFLRYRTPFPAAWLFVDGDDQLCGHLAGPVTPAQFVSWAAGVNEAWKRWDALLFKLRSRPSDAESIKLAFAFAERLQPDKATGLVRSLSTTFRSAERERAWAAIGQAWLALGDLGKAQSAFQMIEGSSDPSIRSIALSGLAETFAQRTPETAVDKLRLILASPDSPAVAAWWANKRMKELDKGGGLESSVQWR